MTEPETPFKSVTYGALVWKQFRHNRPAVVALALVAVIGVIGTFAPFLAGDRPIAVHVPAGESVKVYDGQVARAHTGWFFPAVRNLTTGDLIVFTIFTWVVVQVFFRLLTVDAENPTRRVIRLPELVRKIVLWTVTGLAVLTIAWIAIGEQRLPDTQTDWRAVMTKAPHDVVFVLPPIRYRPYQQDLQRQLQKPSWQMTHLSKKDVAKKLDEERRRLEKAGLGEEDIKRALEVQRTTLEAAPAESAYGHVLGTNHMGRDVASQLIHGARISLVVGFVSVGVAIVIGTFIGALGGYFGGRVDFWVMRFIEVMMCFPRIFLILTISVILPKRSVWSVMAVLGVTGWTGSARLVRGEFFKQRAMEYVTAARAIGGTPMRIMFRHILPNAMAPLLVGATFGIAGAIITESTLSFLNIGVPADVASWGRTLSYGIQNVRYSWWLIMFPGIAIFITVTSYNLAGEGLRDAIDPRMRA